MSEAHLPVFVYGTLRPGAGNYPRYLAGRTQKEQPAWTRGLLFLVRAEDYPYLTDGPGSVRGELIDLAPEHYVTLLAALDRLEDYVPAQPQASLYLRRPREVILTDGTVRQAWVYLWNGPAGAGVPLPGGDFLAADAR